MERRWVVGEDNESNLSLFFLSSVRPSGLCIYGNIFQDFNEKDNDEKRDSSANPFFFLTLFIIASKFPFFSISRFQHFPANWSEEGGLEMIFNFEQQRSSDGSSCAQSLTLGRGNGGNQE